MSDFHRDNSTKDVNKFWEELSKAELRGDLTQAVHMLEQRLDTVDGLAEPECVIRLGFDLWYSVAEEMTLSTPIPSLAYAERFVELYGQWKHLLRDNADFCWVFGLGISLYWKDLPGTNEMEGQSLLQQAQHLDPFWSRLMSGQASAVEQHEHLGGRGLLADYYAM